VATKNPWVLGGIVIAAILIVIVIWFVTDSFHDVQNTAYCGLPDTPCGRTASQTVETQNTVAIYKTGPGAVGVGDAMGYNISVTYTGPGVATLQITDTLPAEITNVINFSPDDPAIGQRNGNTFTWTLNNVPSNTPQFVFINIFAPANDEWLQNTATVRVLSSSLNPGGNTAQWYGHLGTRG